MGQETSSSQNHDNVVDVDPETTTEAPPLDQQRGDHVIDVDQESSKRGPAETAASLSTAGTDPEENPLDPPLLEREKRRDWLLDFLDNNKYIVLMNCFVLFIVVASGAVWFFMITGWHTLCEPKTNCHPRNQVYNVSIQILTGCFSWMVSVVYPWRCAQLLHTVGCSCPLRSNDVGHDLNGQSTDNVWYHVPKRKRLCVLLVLHLNTLFQFANQVARGIYNTNAAANRFPGNILTSMFFGLSFIMAGLGGSLYWMFTSEVRKHDKERFGLGPLDTLKHLWEEHVSSPK